MPRPFRLLIGLSIASLLLGTGILVWLNASSEPDGYARPSASVGASKRPSTRAPAQAPPPPVLAPARDAGAPRPTLGPGARHAHYPREDVSGYVVDAENHAPVVGARVFGRGPRGADDWAETRTDAHGRYVLPLTAYSVSRTTLVVAAEGYAPRAIPFSERTPEARLPTTRLERIRAWIPGLAVDVLGRPVADASVRVEGHERVYVTGADGRFGPIPVGKEDLEWAAWSPLHALTRDEWDIERKTLPALLRVRLAVADPVLGIVVDAEGRPVGGASVWQQGTVGACTVRSAADGSFRFPLRVGRAEILVAATATALGRAEAYGGGRVRIVLADGRDLRWPSHGPPPPPSPDRKVVTAWRGLPMCVVDASRHPLAGASVYASWTDPGGSTREVTGQDGRCRLRIPADRPVAVGAGHHAGWRGRLRIVPGDVATVGRVDLVLDPHVWVRSPLQDWPEAEEDPGPCLASGRVLDAAGRPFPDVDVRTPASGFDVTADDGTFFIEGESSALRTRLVLDASGYLLHEREVPTGSSDLVIRMPARSVIRWRLGGGTLEEDEQVSYRIWDWPRRGDGDLPRGYSLRQGMVSLEGESLRLDCPSGRVAVAVRVPPGPWVFHPDVEVRAGRETVFDYDFTPLGHLEGVVRDRHGVPVRNAWIRVATIDHTIERTDDEGRFSFGPDNSVDALPAGIVRLRVGAKTHASALTRPLDLRVDQRIEVTLPDGAILRGVVVDADGRPVDGKLEFVPDVGPPWTHAWTDARGRFVFPVPLPEGRARLRVQVEGRSDLDVPTDVRAGSDVRIVVR